MTTQTLFIYPDAHWQALSWLMIAQGETVSPQTGTLADCEHWLADHAVGLAPRLVVILPVEAALHTVVTVPRKQRRFLARSLPFILEAQTAQDIDELHIVPGESLPDDQVGVLAVPHRIMARTIEVAAELNLDLIAVLLDSQLLREAYSESSLCLAWQGSRVLVNAGGRGLACQRKDVMFWLERAWPERLQADASASGPTTLLVPAEKGGEAATLQAELSQQVGGVESPQTVPSGWLPMLADLWLRHPTRSTLLTGPYERKSQFTAWRKYVPAVAIAGGLFAVASVLFFWQDLQRTEALANATWRAVEDTFLEATPDGISFNVSQFRQTAEDLVRRAPTTNVSESHFMGTLMNLNEAIAERAIEMEEIRYMGAGQETQLQVTAASTRELEAFRDALEQARFGVTYSAGRVGTGFRGNYRLQFTGGDR